MTPLKRSSNIAARMGRWSARHRKTAIFGWLAFVVAVVVIGGAVGTKQLGDNDTLPGESGRAARILDAGFEQPASETVLVQSRTLTADSPAFRAAVADVERRVSAVDVVANVQSPYAKENPGRISADGHSAIVEFDIRGDSDEAVDKIDPVIDASTRPRPRTPSSQSTSSASARTSSSTRSSTRTSSGRACSLPVTIVILVIAFGALVAAGIPLLGALGRDGDHGPAGDPQPGLARRREHQRDRAADRPRRRGRLLDVLLEARA